MRRRRNGNQSLVVHDHESASRERRRFAGIRKSRRDADAPSENLSGVVVVLGILTFIMAVATPRNRMDRSQYTLIGQGGTVNESAAEVNEFALSWRGFRMTLSGDFNPLNPAANPTADWLTSASGSARDIRGTSHGSNGVDPSGMQALIANRREKYSAAADQHLDGTAHAYFATITTAKGDIVVELWPELAPQHVNAFAFLIREGYYDGLQFHRVEPGFVIQGGDPTGTGSGGPGFTLPAEFNTVNPVPHRAGTLAMARTSDPNSAGSQFYIVLEDGESVTRLDGQYTVFGHTVRGMDVVRRIQVGDVMRSVTFEQKPKHESVVSPDDLRDVKLPDGIEDRSGGYP